jgi:hypothetical protein
MSHSQRHTNHPGFAIVFLCVGLAACKNDDETVVGLETVVAALKRIDRVVALLHDSPRRPIPAANCRFNLTRDLHVVCFLRYLPYNRSHMPAAAHPDLEANRVYRTRQFARWGKNPSRLVQRLVAEGKLCALAHGLYYAPSRSRFGMVPPRDDELLRAFLETDDYVLTGPPAWTTLGLGATAMFASTLVYNRKRSGEFELGGRTFLLRRVAFPASPPREWFAIDLIEHQAMAGVAPDALAAGLMCEVRARRLDPVVLAEMAANYGTHATSALVRRCIQHAQEAA